MEQAMSLLTHAPFPSRVHIHVKSRLIRPGLNSIADCNFKNGNCSGMLDMRALPVKLSREFLGNHADFTCRDSPSGCAPVVVSPHKLLRRSSGVAAAFNEQSEGPNVLKIVGPVRRKGQKRFLQCNENVVQVTADSVRRATPLEHLQGKPKRCAPPQWDVVGLGQAMVDFSGMVDDAFLESLHLQKGARKVVDHEERGAVLRALDGKSYKVSAGGSLSNTLVALARLGAAHSAPAPPLRVAMTGSVGSDPLGDFYRTKLQRANVQFLSKPVEGGTTGTVVVLTTPDAHRTMLAYQGMSSMVSFDEGLEEAVLRASILVVEGYLWEIPQTIEAIASACKAARSCGVTVALTASDVTCVARHRDQFWDVLCESADILFANSDEARALSGLSSSSSPALAATILSRFCPLVSVTDGARGSYLACNGEVAYVAPSPCVAVDTCGAGDAYAAGILYGLLRCVPDLRSIGSLAASVASVVVAQQGTRLRQEDAAELAAALRPKFGAYSKKRVDQILGIRHRGEAETTDKLLL